MVANIICGGIEVAIIGWLIWTYAYEAWLDKRERLKRGEEL